MLLQGQELRQKMGICCSVASYNWELQGYIVFRYGWIQELLKDPWRALSSLLLPPPLSPFSALPPLRGLNSLLLQAFSLWSGEMAQGSHPTPQLQPQQEDSSCAHKNTLVCTCLVVQTGQGAVPET